MAEKKPTPKDAAADEAAAPAAPKTFDELYADMIREKMVAGLTREQAIEVIKRQNQYDAENAAPAPVAAAK